MRRSLRRALGPLLLAATLALAGCGDDQPESATDEPSQESPTGSPEGDGETDDKASRPGRSTSSWSR